jgi:hypothetical protein
MATMTRTLIRPVHDTEGKMHKPGELGRIAHQGPRARFDLQNIIKVTFKDGSRVAVFEDEVDLSTHTEAAVQYQLTLLSNNPQVLPREPA